MPKIKPILLGHRTLRSWAGSDLEASFMSTGSHSIWSCSPSCQWRKIYQYSYPAKSLWITTMSSMARFQRSNCSALGPTNRCVIEPETYTQKKEFMCATSKLVSYLHRERSWDIRGESNAAAFLNWYYFYFYLLYEYINILNIYPYTHWQM